jgi:hypothetical protein
VVERGDPNGAAVWKRVLAAIDVLLLKEGPDGQALR